MRWMTSCLGAFVVATAAVTSPVLAEQAVLPAASGLGELARQRGVQLGTAVALDPLETEASYRDRLAREFASVVAENAMKFEFLQPEIGLFDFRQADRLVNFAAEQQMQVRGHTLVWHWALPDWLEDRNWSRDELLAILKYHIKTVVGRYRGDIVVWDVVNEAIAKDGTLRDTLWLRGIGPEYIELAFRWAHEADPDALLIYNDFGNEGFNAKSDAIYQLVRSLLEKGVPIHGVGLQMHLRADRPPDPSEVAANFERFADLGLQVQITEIDVRIRQPSRAGDLERQAQIYRDMLQVCLQAENCTSFTTWGFTDRHSWVPTHFEGWGEALIFDKNYQPKPAYRSLLEVLSETQAEP